MLALDFNERAGRNGGQHPGRLSFLRHQLQHLYHRHPNAGHHPHFGGIERHGFQHRRLRLRRPRCALRRRTAARSPNRSSCATSFSRTDRPAPADWTSTITGLTPNRAIASRSGPSTAAAPAARVSDWSANGVPGHEQLHLQRQRPCPLTNDRYRFDFDASGRIGTHPVRPARSRQRGTLRRFPQRVADCRAHRRVGHQRPGRLMFSNTATAYLRVPFNVSDPAVSPRSRCACATTTASSPTSTASRRLAQRARLAAVELRRHRRPYRDARAEDITIFPTPGLLVHGANVLAIHGLNVGAGDADFFLAPELMAQQITELTRPLFPAAHARRRQRRRLSRPGGRHEVQRGPRLLRHALLALHHLRHGRRADSFHHQRQPALADQRVRSSPRPSPSPAQLHPRGGFLTGYIPSDIDTHSYIFLRDVLRQSNNIPNYPTIWQASYPADYAMDSNIVNHPVYGPTISNDLRSIPSLCIVSDTTGFGIRRPAFIRTRPAAARPGNARRRVELIRRATAHTEFAVNCAKSKCTATPAATTSARPSIRCGCRFNSDYGPTKLRYDWFGGGVDEHDRDRSARLRFRGWLGRALRGQRHLHQHRNRRTFRGLRYRPENTCYLRDVWVKDSFRDMGWTASRSAFVHLYINGLYWGLYEPSERLDASYFAEHYGGLENAWDVIVGEDNDGPPVVVDGSLADWQNVLNLAQRRHHQRGGLPGHRAARRYRQPHRLHDAPHLRRVRGLAASQLVCRASPRHQRRARDEIRSARLGPGIDARPRSCAATASTSNIRRRNLRPGPRLSAAARLAGVPPSVRRPRPQTSVQRRRAHAEQQRRAPARAGRGHLATRSSANPRAGATRARPAFRPAKSAPASPLRATNGGSRKSTSSPRTFSRSSPRTTSRASAPAACIPRSARRASTSSAARCRPDSVGITHTNAAGTIYFTTDGTDPRVYGTGAMVPGGDQQAYLKGGAPIVVGTVGRVLDLISPPLADACNSCRNGRPGRSRRDARPRLPRGRGEDPSSYMPNGRQTALFSATMPGLDPARSLERHLYDPEMNQGQRGGDA